MRTVEQYDAIEDDGEKQAPQRHNEAGEELLDPTPIALPFGYKKTLTLSEQIAQQVRRMKVEFLRDNAIEESDEDADDFEVGDDYEPLSQYENDHIPSIKVLKRQALVINKKIDEANRRAAIAAHENALKKPVGITNPPINPENKEPVKQD